MNGNAKSPAGAWQWHPINCSEEDMVPQVDGSDQKVLPMMTTADMSLKTDPAYKKICERFLANPDEFGETLRELGLSYFTEIWVLDLITQLEITRM